MNWKALRKTLTPSFEAVKLVALVAFVMFAAIFILSALIVGFVLIIQHLFGTAVAGWTVFVMMVCFYGYIFLVEPLMDRYKTIKWQLEMEEKNRV